MRTYPQTCRPNRAQIVQFLQWATRQPNTWVLTFAQALAYYKSPPGTQVRGDVVPPWVPDASARYAGPSACAALFQSLLLLC